MVYDLFRGVDSSFVRIQPPIAIIINRINQIHCLEFVSMIFAPLPATYNLYIRTCHMKGIILKRLQVFPCSI